jgi:alkylation response protein AidB-like acyl-CoA dehydrogenase
MNFTFTDEQQLLSDTVSRFVREHYSFEARREILKSQPGWSREVWTELANLGLTALNVPERYDGLGSGPVETMLVMNALGKGLVLEPFLSAAVIAPALLGRLDETPDVAQLCVGIASGERLVVVAHHEPQSRGVSDEVATRITKHRDDYVLHGQKSVVLHGPFADEFLVTALGPEGQQLSIVRVPKDAKGVKLINYRTFDGQSATHIEFDQVKVSRSALLGSGDRIQSAIQSSFDIGLSALCAEAVGIIEAVNQATLEYTKGRKQFGQPISRFQALQHRMADMFIHAEQAKSMSYLAAMHCEDEDPLERRQILSAAKVIVGQAARFVGQQAVQLHGGMGMTDEMLVSHYFKRLTAIELTFGDTDHHLQRFASRYAAA